MFPELENMSGTINAAVMVGEISAIFCASSSTKLRTCGLRRGSVDPEGEVESEFMLWF